MPYRLPLAYQAFGLSLQSALPLPELREDEAPPAVPDVVVSIGSAPRPAGAMLEGAHHCVGSGLFWMEIAGVARLLALDGREIRVEPEADAAPGDVRAYLLGSGIGAVLHQRGWLPLHASAVEVDGRAIAFVAPSGGGKSTMAMQLDRLGHTVLCDDICAIDTGAEVPRLWPGLRNLKLWRASLDAIDAGTDGLEPVIARLDKYRFPIAQPAEYRPYDLAAVVLLDWGERLEMAALPGAEAVAALVANTYRGQFVAAMGEQAGHWRQCLAVFEGAELWRLTRPRALDGLATAAAAVVDAVRATTETA